MKLLEFSYKNILSYGNLLQTFKFKDEAQLILVEGENGAGKSSIKEALTVSIYGRSAIRKMKDIPNWINKNAYTNVKFVTNSGEFIEIDRGIEPNFSDIKINNSPFNLPDKRKVDEFIEEELSKIPFSVFCNTISLSFDDFKSFVNLTQADKRKIVDRIFGIDILTDMRGVVKEDLKQNKKSLEILNSQIEKNTTTLNTSTDQLSQLKEKLNKKKETQSEDISVKIETKKKTVEEVKQQYSDLKKSIEDFQKNLNSVRDEMSTARVTIQDLANKLALYQKNRCPHCLNDLTSESSVKTKDAIEAKKKVVESKLPTLKTAFTDITDKITALTEDQNTSKSEYYELTAEIKLLESELQKTVDELGADETESIQAIINSIQGELQTDNLTATEKEEQANLFNILDDLLSDSGIKKTLIDKIIPTLNNRIKIISERLEFKFQFEFDSGQRKKMNIIVLLAFIEIIKMKHSQLNVLFLDEIFSSLDKNNVYRAIEILKEYAEKYKMTIFVVSHESLPEEFFNSKIFVTTQDHFSEMKITQIGA